MDKRMMALDDLIPHGMSWSEDEVFEPCSHYYSAMDCVVFLREDLPYRADRVDDYLTLLWHPEQDRAIGLKIKGFRFLFGRAKAMLSALGHDLPDAIFVPLMGVIEVAITVRGGAVVTEVEQERIDDRKRITIMYDHARKIAGTAQVDTRQVVAS